MLVFWVFLVGILVGWVGAVFTLCRSEEAICVFSFVSSISISFYISYHNVLVYSIYTGHCLCIFLIQISDYLTLSQSVLRHFRDSGHGECSDRSLASRHRYHPMRRFLNSISKWISEFEFKNHTKTESNDLINLVEI